jgi:hypothetical protein
MTGAVAPIPSVASAPGSRVALGRMLPLLTAAIVFGAGALVADASAVGSVRDDAMYLVLAKSLATGHGLHWLHLPGAPPATHFPPGYPALLAVCWWLFPAFPANVVVFKLANALLCALAALATARFVENRFGMSDIGAHGFALVAMLGAPTLSFSALVMSEPLFLALLVPALLLAERVTADSSPTRDIVLLGLIAGAATLVRTNGIALLAAVGFVFCLRRRFREAAIFGLVALAILLPWQLWASVHAGAVPAPMRGNYESYGGWLAAGLRSEGMALLPRTAARTSGELAIMFRALVAPGVPSSLGYVAVALLAALSAFGTRAVWRRAPVASVFLGAYATIVIFWPFTPGRFVWGVWPLVLLLPVIGAREIIAVRSAAPRLRALRVAALAATAMLVCGYATFNVRGYRDRSWKTGTRAFSGKLQPLLSWVASHTARDALLATESEGSVYLYTGRPTVPVGTFTVNDYFKPRTSADNAEAMRIIIQRYQPNAVVVSWGWYRDAVRELALRQPPVLAAIDTFPGGGIVLVPTSR